MQPRSPRRGGIGMSGIGLLVVLTAVLLAMQALPGVAPLACAAIGARPRAERPPNVIVVMLDDMRADELRYAPVTREHVVDRGLTFPNAFSPFPLCCPARASLLLGQYAHNHGVLFHEDPFGFGSIDDSRTVAGRLQDAGYRTALVGKYLNQYGRQRSRVTGGPSQHYVPAGWTDWMAGLETDFPPGSPWRGNTYDYFSFTQNINGRTVSNRGSYSSTVIATQVADLITRYHRQDAPFFIWANPVAPHHGDPIEPDDPPLVRTSAGREYRIVTPARPDSVKGMFDDVITRAPGVRRRGPAEADISDKPWNLRRWPEATAEEKRAMRTAARQRAESIYAWDQEFGRIIARLKRTGEYERTIIVFTSDNGYYLGEHRQRQGKIKPHEPSLKVPFAVAGPGIAPGVRYAPITTVDLTATILDIAGARRLPAMDGRSRYDVMVGPDQPWDVPVVTEGYLDTMPNRAGTGIPGKLTLSGIRTGRYKLTRYGTAETELYDLYADPNELRSVWDDPAYATVRRDLLTVWRGHRDCRAQTCQTSLPDDLVATPAELRWQVANADWWHRVYYGG